MKKFLKQNWLKSLLLAIILLGVGTLISYQFPLQTKIQSYIGFPFRIYGEGIFPWLGDLENKKVFFWDNLFYNLIFWYIISLVLIRIYYKFKK